MIMNPTTYGTGKSSDNFKAIDFLANASARFVNKGSVVCSFVGDGINGSLVAFNNRSHSTIANIDIGKVENGVFKRKYWYDEIIGYTTVEENESFATLIVHLRNEYLNDNKIILWIPDK